MDLYRLTIQDSQDSMQFDLLDAPIKIEDVEGAVDNTVLTGDIFTDYLFLKKRWEQKWAIMCKDEYERLRGFYTRQWSLATVPSVKVTQGYLKDTEWEGQIFYINAPYGGEVSSLTKMTGDTFQQTISGKNLFDQSSSYTQGYIDANGTIQTTSTSVTNDDYFAVSPNTTYAVSWTPVISGATVRKLAYYTSSKSIIGRSGDLTDGGTFTTPANCAFIRAYLNCPSGISADDAPLPYIKDIQIEAGSTATSYEPYVGGYPSPNPEYPQPIQTVTGEQTISINGTEFPINLGKNLLDPTNGWTNQSISTTGAISTNANTALSGYIMVKPNQNYTFSQTQLTSTDYKPNIVSFYSAEDASAFIGRYQVLNISPQTFTTPSNCRFIRFGYYNSGGMNANDIWSLIADAQLEEGGSVSQYAPYVAPIELCKLGDSQDSIYYDGTDWILEKQTVTRQFNGDDTDINAQGWFNSSDTNATTQVVAINCRAALDGKFSEEDKSLMTHFYHVGGNLSPVSNGMFKTVTGTGYPDSIVYVRIAIAKSIAPDVNGAKAWIAANKPTLYMPKLTPTQTTITDQTLIAQLEAIREALIEGQNLVEVTANGSNLPAKSITLQGIEGRENPILPQTNVRIGLSDGGVLNACECRQNVTLSMRETA